MELAPRQPQVRRDPLAAEVGVDGDDQLAVAVAEDVPVVDRADVAQAVEHAEGVERPQAVGRLVDADAVDGRVGARLDHVDLHPAPGQRRRRGEAADPGADDQRVLGTRHAQRTPGAEYVSAAVVRAASLRSTCGKPSDIVGW